MQWGYSYLRAWYEYINICIKSFFLKGEKMSDLVEVIIASENGENQIVCERKFLLEILTACLDNHIYCRIIKITDFRGVEG